MRDELRGMQIFRDVEFECVGGLALQQLYRQSKNSIVRKFNFANNTVLPEIAGVDEAYIGYVPLKEFFKLVQDDAGEILGSIFLENVRDWRKYTPTVNGEIRKTVISDKTDRFVVMNNGITMIARTLQRLPRSEFQIEDFQIVNGCQTTNVLWDQRNEITGDIQIPLRLIWTRDDNVIKDIIRGTNRQTKVEEDQFFALTEFAEQLEDFFSTFDEPHRLYYERRSGQYVRPAIKSTRIVPHRALVKMVASMFLEIPHEASRRYTALVERVGREIFAAGHRLEPYYTAALASYRLERSFKAQRFDRNMRYHILLAMRYLANPEPKPPMNAKSMEAYCKVITDQLWNPTKAADLCSHAVALVEQVADSLFTREDDGQFNRDDIRTQPFTERVVKRCRGLLDV